jgi:hypothetical protein
MEMEHYSSEASSKVISLEEELLRTNEQLAVHMSEREVKIDKLTKQIDVLTKSARDADAAYTEKLATATKDLESWKVGILCKKIFPTLIKTPTLFCVCM